MKSRLLVILQFLTILSSIDAIGFRVRPTKFFESTTAKQTPFDFKFIAQSIDHQNASTGTFSQKYLLTNEYKTNSQIAFLFISEEGNVESAYLSEADNPIIQNAKIFGAPVFAIEHRFYGNSTLFQSNTVDNLKYLTSSQAIDDIAFFLKNAPKENGLVDDVKWILWGYGYGGVLAAETRRKYPNLVSGSIAMSAPLRHKFDFWEFNQHITTAIDKIDQLLPNLNCHQNIQEAFKNVSRLLLTSDGRQQLSDDLKLFPRLEATNLTYKDIQSFYAAIINPFQVVVQLHNDLGYNIQSMCQIMKNESFSQAQRIYQVFNYINRYQYSPIYISYSDSVADLTNTNASSVFAVDRLAFWQECTEFGWNGNSNTDENAIFGASLPQSLFLHMCSDVFPEAQLTAIKIYDAIEGSNNKYGGNRDFSGTNVVFINGEYDPLNRLLKSTSEDISVVTYTIPGASYAPLFFPGVNQSDVGIQKAQKIITENIRLWFTSPPNPKTFVNTTEPWVRPPINGLMSLKVDERIVKLADDVPSKKTFPAGGYKRVLMGRPPHGFKPLLNTEKLGPYPVGFEEGAFRQKVDHFDNRNPLFFHQKFYKNSQWAKPGGPNFLMIGGEGPESARWVLDENLTWLTFAKKYGATVYLLEHRYYGDSIVGNNTDLKYLSSLQMLYDLAEFIRYFNAQTPSTATPWITFGGSYSGAMSAWMREVFPDLVIGAVASSAPVFTKTDFFEYLMVVENSIRSYNKSCADAIESGFKTMHQLFLTKEGRQNLTDIFTLKPAFDDSVTEIDQHYFFSNIYSNFQGAVQYSGDNTGAYATGYGIPDVCSIMLNSSNSPIQNVAAVNVYMTTFYNGDFDRTDNKYSNMVDDLKNAQQYGPESAASLLWTWQTCTEFGYFQSADSGKSIFGTSSPVNMFVQLCKDVFGESYDRTFIDSSIDFTNYKYGSRDQYRGTNVVLPNGSVDPWHALGCYSNQTSSVASYLMEGTAHCADMYPARDQDVPDLKIVRNLISNNIQNWLNAQPVGSNSTDTTTTQPTQATTTTKVSQECSSFFSICFLVFFSFFIFN